MTVRANVARAEQTVAVRVTMVDLNRRTAVVHASDDEHPAFSHVLRGTLAAMLADPGWHVTLVFDGVVPERPAVAGVVDQAQRWAVANGCRLSVTTTTGVAGLTGQDA